MDVGWSSGTVQLITSWDLGFSMHSENPNSMSDPIVDSRYAGTVLLSTSHIAIFKAGIDTASILNEGAFNNASDAKNHVDYLDSQIIAQLQAEAAGEIVRAARSVRANTDLCFQACDIVMAVLEAIDPGSDILSNPLFTSFFKNAVVNLRSSHAAETDVSFTNSSGKVKWGGNASSDCSVGKLGSWNDSNVIVTIDGGDNLDASITVTLASEFDDRLGRDVSTIIVRDWVLCSGQEDMLFQISWYLLGACNTVVKPPIEVLDNCHIIELDGAASRANTRIHFPTNLSSDQKSNLLFHRVLLVICMNSNMQTILFVLLFAVYL